MKHPKHIYAEKICIFNISICLRNSLKPNVTAFVNWFMEVYNYIFWVSENYIKIIQWSENDIILY